MAEQHRATSDEWASVEALASGGVAYSTILELRDRIEALEAPQSGSIDLSHLSDAEREKIRKLLANPGRFEVLEVAQPAKPNHPEKPDSSLVEQVEDANESKLLTLLSKQLEHCKAQDYTDTEAAQAIIDTAADWFEDTLNQIGMSPAMIPNLLRWQAHQHEYLQ